MKKNYLKTVKCSPNVLLNPLNANDFTSLFNSPTNQNFNCF